MTAFRGIGWCALAAGLCGPIGERVSAAAPPAANAALPAATVTAAPTPVSLTDYTLTNWPEEQGPFPFGIYSIAQDQTGYLWLGTRTGLVRFDGSEFLPWQGRQQLPDDRIAAILAARDGSLWVGFGTVGGVARISGGTATPFTTTDGLAQGDVNAIVEDAHATVWVASHGGLSAYDGQRWRIVSEADGLPRGPVLGLRCDSRGRLWVGTATGLYRRSAGERIFSPVEAGSDADVAEDRAGTVWVSDPHEAFRIVGTSRPSSGPLTGRVGAGRGLLIDRSGALWVGTRGGGLMRVHGDIAGVDPGRIEYLTRRQGLLSDEVRALFQDRDGSLWIGSRRGLSRLSESNIRAVLHGAVSDDFVAAVAVTRDGAVWTATAMGLTRRHDSEERTFTEQDGLPGRIVTALHEDARGTLWAATTLGVARLVGHRFFPLLTTAGTVWSGYQIRAIASERDGTLWLCDQERGLFRWKNGVIDNLSEVIGQRKAYIVHVDRTGRVWIGFWAGGLSVYDHGTVSTYGTEHGLPQASVNAIFEDRSGGLWVATEHDLARVDGQRIRTFKTNGFPQLGVVSIVEDAVGDFWIGLGPSLMRIDPREFDTAAADPGYQLRYRLYGAEDGLPGTVGRPGVPSVARTTRGELLFVTSVGLAVVDPGRLRDRPAPTLIAVNGVSADGRPIEYGGDHIAIPSQATRFVINYSLLNLTAGRPRFRHKLEGFDVDWQDVGERRDVSYTNLPPGTYTFRLSSHHEDAWIESRSPLAVTILPAFYQTKTFYAVAASTLALLLWFGWRRRVRQMNREFALVLAERSRLGREIHDTLLQSLVAVALEFDDIAEQLEPARVALKAQVISIRTRVEQYILEARQSIANLRSPMLVQSDLGTALQRSGESATATHPIHFEFTLRGMPRRLDAILEEQLLRIGQEAMSNAVRHGAASTIHMELCFDQAAVRLRVSDNGCGFDPNQPTREADGHWGIAGMRERAARVGAQLRLESQPGAGTTVEALASLMAHG